MDTTSKKKENIEQITFRDPELWADLKELSEKTDNSGIGPKAKELLKAALLNKKQQTKDTSVAIKEIKPLSVAVEKIIPHQDILETGVINKLDIIGNLLLQLLATSNDQENEETKAKIEEAVAGALEEFEQEFRSQHLLLRFTEAQKNLIIDLFEFRKTGDARLEKIEDLFFSMLKEQFLFGEVADGFEEKFREVFPEYFTKELTEDEQALPPSPLEAFIAEYMKKKNLTRSKAMVAFAKYAKDNMLWI